MIHCTMEDLLALKDSEGTAWARRHLGECAVCRQELDALHQRVARLKALPAVMPSRDRWPVIRDRIVSERRQRRGMHIRWAAVAAAAAVTAVVGTRAIDQRHLEATRTADLVALQARSQELETKLRDLDPNSRVVSGGTAGAVADLEDRIADVDAALQQRSARNVSRDQDLDLWRQRVQLMQGLVNVHVTRAAYVGM